MELESERRRNMIFDSISNKENYKEEKEIYQTLNFLEKLKKWDDVESNAIIQKDWISANPVSFLSKDESECMYEAHRKHIDFQSDCFMYLFRKLCCFFCSVA